MWLLRKLSRARVDMAMSVPASATSKALVTAWGFFFVLAVLTFTILPGSDPYRCRALLHTGRWVDPADENGDRLPFHQWQPDNCMMHEYTSDDLVQCMGNNTVAISGDSTNRQNAEAFIRMMNFSEEVRKNYSTKLIGVWKIPYRNLTLKFVWNPYLQDHGHWNPFHDSRPLVNLTEYTEEVARYKSDVENHVPVNERKGASLFLFGAGPWFAQPFNAREVETWNIIFQETMRNVSNIFPKKTLNPFTAPMDPEEGMGNQVLFVPPTRGHVTGHDLIDMELHDMEQRQLRKYQRWFRENEPNLNFHIAWALAKVVEGQNKTFVDPHSTGWHYIDDVAMTRINIALNYRCNAKLARKNWPINGSCCTDYGHKPPVESLLVCLAMILLVPCLILEARDLLSYRSTPRFQLLNMDTGGALALPLLMSHYADRTQLMGKGEKVLQYESIAAICIVWVIIVLLTIRKLSEPSETSNADRTFLSQSQINEWRGLVLLLFVSIAWANHQSTLCSIVMAVLGSSFLFQSAYDNATYFLATGDYSGSRAADVLLRLNIFTCLLCYFTSTNYINYQYVLLASFFFLVVWATMALGGVKSKTNVGHALVSIVASMVVITILIRFTPAPRIVVYFFKIFNVHWETELLENHLSRDLYIPYAGMLLAIAKHKLGNQLKPAWTYSSGFIGIIVLALYWSTWSRKGLDLFTYMQWHSIASMSPILAYICLRNMSATIRNHQSKALELVGKCSIQLYALHFHLFLASNSHSVLLTGLFTGDGSLLFDRWRELVFIAPLFFLAGYLATKGTSNVIRFFFPTSSPQRESGPAIQSTILELKDENETEVEEILAERPLLDYSMHTFQIPLTKISVAVNVVRGLLWLLALWALNIFSPGAPLHKVAAA